MEIRSDTMDFPARSGFGPQTKDIEFVFPRPVLNVTAVLSAYSFVFEDGDDHEVGQLHVRLTTETNNNVVVVTGELGLRDWSHAWDDKYGGRIDFVVLADLEDVAAVPPRRDLIVTDLEINQATQYFRSNQYLDGAHVMPDNSIPLSALKATGVRVYLDYDAMSGLPPIHMLSGVLTVRTPTSQFDIAALNDGQVVPRRDSQINHANENHTLNFVIPGAWCLDEMDITVVCFETGNASQRAATVSRTLQFHDIPPLNIYTVGIHYTGQGRNDSAPPQTDILNDFFDMEAMFPHGTFNVTGYSILDFDEDLAGDLGNGCGSGFGAILDDLNDLKGESDDIYIAELPNGPNGGGVGGCGSRPNGVCVVFTGKTIGLAHEAGHALGRKHTPCPTCKPPPSNPDDDFPQYGNFDRASIGTFGFNCNTGGVFDPATTGDLMSYSTSRWISPHTYNALKGGRESASSADGSEPELAQRANTQVLHLGLDITRPGIVTRRPSFHYDTIFTGSGTSGHFSIEILNDWGRLRSRTSFGGDACGCGCHGDDAWPVSFRGRLVMPPDARFLNVWHGERKIYEETIPPQPYIVVLSKKSTKEGMQLTWETFSPENKKKLYCIWYLLHWFDVSSKTWRGVAPRSQEPSIVVPYRLFGCERSLRLRIYATTGIATGLHEIEIEAGHSAKDRNDILFHVSAQLPQQGLLGESGGKTALKAYALDGLGRSLPVTKDVSWFAGDDKRIGRSSTVLVDSNAYRNGDVGLLIDDGKHPLPRKIAALKKSSANKSSE